MALLAVGVAMGFWAGTAQAEGSADLYRSGNGARANLEWRNSTYGNLILRRTLLKVYAQPGEFILMGSSAIGAPIVPNPPNGAELSNADIRLYKPGRVTGAVGSEAIPGTADFSCNQQRSAIGAPANQGRITSRAQENAGPDTVPAGGNAGGYVPCYYQVPLNEPAGIYNVVISGPQGDNSNAEIPPTGLINDNPPASDGNYNSLQATNSALWDVTVRSSLAAVNNPPLTGRLFSYYLTLYTGDNARPQFPTVFLATEDGYQYQIDMRGLDPNGYVIYSNDVGFYDSDGASLLYHDVVASPTSNFSQQNQLVPPQGGVSLALPSHPIFFNRPDPLVLAALGYRANPIVPVISNLTFTGTQGSTTWVGYGGTFRFNSNIKGIFELVISRDGVNYDPTNPLNKVLRGKVGAGPAAIQWNGRDNAGNVFPVGNNYAYQVHANLHAGENHFPLLDAENDINGGPTVTMINPPNGVCPPIIGCRGAYYDDRGYRTLNGTTVGTVNAVLCGGNPPSVPYTGFTGFDTISTQRAFGFPAGGNPQMVCDPTGGFGDKKGLDLWTYFPSQALNTALRIIDIPTNPPDTPRPTFTPTIAITATATITPTETVPPPTPTFDPGTPTAPPDTGTGSQITPPAPTETPLPGFPNTGRAPVRQESEENTLGWWLMAIGSLMVVSGLGAGRLVHWIRRGRDRR